MKNVVASVLFLFVSISIIAQNSNLEYKNSLKLYNLTSFDQYNFSRPTNDSLYNHYLNENSSFQILHPTVAYQWKDDNNSFHEIELTGFMFNKQDYQTDLVVDTSSRVLTSYKGSVITAFVSLQYEYIYNFNKIKDCKLVPSIGFGINPYFKLTNSHPESSSEFPSSQTYIGAKVFFIPRLTYFVTSKFFIDLNIQLCILDDYYFVDKQDNPLITIQQRTQSTLNIDLIPMIFRGRIGVGIKI